MENKQDLRPLFSRFLADMNGIGELEEVSFTTCPEAWQNEIMISVRGHDGCQYTLKFGTGAQQDEAI